MKRRKRNAPVSTRDNAAVEYPMRPTPQTVAKLRRDLICHLYDKGRLRMEHLEVAEEIRRLWQAFSRTLGPSAVNYAAMARPSRQKIPYTPSDWLTERQEIAWRRRYRPWAREAALVKCGGVLPANRLQIVLEIVVDNRGLRQIEGEYRMRHGLAFEHLRDGLQRYAEIAGWVVVDSNKIFI